MRYTTTIVLVALLLIGSNAASQSLEIMPGTENFFADVQWVKPIDKSPRWSVFSRARATVDYDNNTDLFTGAYVNYTTQSGFGATLVGRISSSKGGADIGPHYFKASKSFLIFALPSIELARELGYSWFSIIRFTPGLNEQWKLYSSLELFTLFSKAGHAASVQRIRLGLDRNGYQFGLALNLSEVGKEFNSTFTNPGVFLRKQF